MSKVQFFKQQLHEQREITQRYRRLMIGLNLLVRALPLDGLWTIQRRVEWLSGLRELLDTHIRIIGQINGPQEDLPHRGGAARGEPVLSEEVAGSSAAMGEARQEAGGAG